MAPAKKQKAAPASKVKPTAKTKAKATSKARSAPKAKAKAKAKKAAPKKAAPKKAAPKKAAPKKAAPKKAAPKKAAPKKAAPKKVAPKKPAPRKAAPAPAVIEAPTLDAVPLVIAGQDTDASRSLSARERMVRSSPVVEILDDDHPIGALRRFLDSVKGEATPQQAQIALGSAQLMLLPMAREQRGTQEVAELVDLVTYHWEDFGERRKGFHAQEFLRNAFAAIGIDRERIMKLEELIPQVASSELLFNLACAHAVARDKVAMLRAVERALEAGASSPEFRREPDFAPYANDPDLALLLARAEVPPIPVDIEPYLPGVRAALDALLQTLKEFGESVDLRPGVRLDAILDAERAGKVSLPNDYRALLTLTNGMRLWEHEFFAVADYRERTRLSTRARLFIEASLGVNGIAECVPVASWGQPTDWLLYDPRGRLRGGEAGYVLMLASNEVMIEDLATALLHMETLAREALGTN